MNRKKNHSLCYPLLTALVVMLLALSFSLPCTHASSPWVEVHPPVLNEVVLGIELIHFIDADTGWAEAAGYEILPGGRTGERDMNVLLHTSDGGQGWTQLDPRDNALGFPIHFSSPTTGRRLVYPRFRNPHARLPDNIEFYQSTDGGLTWQLRHGRVTELVKLGEGARIQPIEDRERVFSTRIHFTDELFGWVIGYTDVWWGWREDQERGLVVGNFVYSTRDGGTTWKCQVKPFPWAGAKDLKPSFKRPVDIDFINRELGWITQLRAAMYRTTDGGLSWKGTGHPHPAAVYGIGDIEFLDESRGWAVGEGVWFTADGGQTWTEKLPGRYGPIFADMNNAWVVGFHRLPTREWEWGTRIIHSQDDGNTWQLEWEGPDFLTYIGYHEVTQTLWAGGVNGIILKRAISTTAVTPKGKLTTLWGKLKADPHTNR